MYIYRLCVFVSVCVCVLPAGSAGHTGSACTNSTCKSPRSNAVERPSAQLSLPLSLSLFPSLSL